MMNDGNDPDLEATIARYREELRAEADLARGDLDELEDHLRDLTTELRERGLPTGVAIAEAARRLGDPRELAREHARVSSPFGPTLSRARAWSAVALLAPLTIYALIGAAVAADHPPEIFELVLGSLLIGGLALRKAWARALVVGVLPFLFAWSIYRAFDWGWSGIIALRLASYGGAFAFVVPWRRRELSLSGFGLMLLVPAHVGTIALMVLAQPERFDAVAPSLAWLAYLGVFSGAVGAILRQRWGALVSAGSAITLAAGPFFALNDFGARAFPGTVMALISLGALAGAGSAIIGWHTAPARRRTAHALTA